MDNVIDFTSIKKERINKMITEYFKKPYSLKNMEKIDKLVEQKSLSIEDHKFFLGFLGFLEEQSMDAVQLFHSLIKMSKCQFELQYAMKWETVAEFGLIFLAIIKKNEPEQYQKFIDMQKFD